MSNEPEKQIVDDDDGFADDFREEVKANPVPEKKKSSKKPLVAIFVILFAIVLGLAGWKWYGQISEYQDKQNEADKQISQLEKQVSDLKGDSVDNSTKDTDATKYLVVKEWGVKFDITNAPQGIRYTISTANAGDEYGSDAETLGWYATEKDQLGGVCNKDDSTSVRVVRSVKSKVVLLGDQQVSPDKKVGQHYYYIVKDLSGGPCSDNVKPGDTAATNQTLAKEQTIHRQFVTVSETVQAN